jgi:hypothetical protein
MKNWVNAHYPGTRTAITEYNWGGHEHINGALAQADVLGIFGREGLDLATLWDPPEFGEPCAFAFRMYRNYEGTGERFGDVAVNAMSADQAKVSAYAAKRNSDGSLTIILINKDVQDLTSSLNVSNFGLGAAATAQAYRYSGANLSQIVPLASVSVPNGAASISLPASSITLLVLAAPVQPCPADADGSGAVNIDDLLMVINSWGWTGSPGSNNADIAPTGGDGQINIDDLLAIINAWGACRIGGGGCGENRGKPAFAADLRPWEDFFLFRAMKPAKRHIHW